jgi:inner membrane protein
MELTSNWPHPSFGGRFLPNSREIDGNGFKAKWQLSALASSARQELLADAGLCGFNESLATQPEHVERGGCVETFGLNFMDPVSVYTLSDRATKYGILFIVLTFVGVGLVEILHRQRVHPIQYLLVGCALSVFFLLLVSLSEHLSFAWAYGLASAACSMLLGFYGSFVLRGAKAGCVFGCSIATLYATLYALLQREQTALLLGSLLLFVVLAVIMFITRRIDWYALMTQMRGAEDIQSAPTAAT